MTMAETEATVAAIPTSGGFLNQLDQEARKVWQLILNVGSENGVRIGQDFVVFSLGEELRDPSTGKSLGAYEIVRGRGEVIHVQAKMCTISSTETKEVFVPSNNALAVAAGMTERSRTVEAPFALVKVGDRARRI